MCHAVQVLVIDLPAARETALIQGRGEGIIEQRCITSVAQEGNPLFATEARRQCVREMLQGHSSEYRIDLVHEIQFQLVHIHPFLDGNGRTSRLLSTLYLYRAGYDFKRLFTISEFYDRDRPAFYRAIQSVREHTMDLTCWVEYFVTGLATQMQEVRERGETIIRLDLLARKQGLSTRQKDILQHILENGPLSIATLVSAYPDIHRRTLQRDLKVLIEKGLPLSEGATNNLTYRMEEGVFY